MLGHPVELVFNQHMTERQADGLATTNVPLRGVSFHRGNRQDFGYGMDALTEWVIADVRSFATSRNTLEVTHLLARPCIIPVS